MRHDSNQLVENNRNFIPPARLMKELFEQQQRDTDALHVRIAKLEKSFSYLCCWSLTAVFLLAVLVIALL